MAKELPYFRFTAHEWLTDDISFEDYTVKGVFIDLCSFYWTRDCSVSVELLNKRFKNAKAELEVLFKSGVISIHEFVENIQIKFLDSQWDLLAAEHEKRSKAGKKGGLRKSSNAKAKLKPGSSYKDKDKDKDNIAKKPKPLKKHDFNQSPFFLKDDWFNALSDWPKNKALDYWERANEYSGSKGVKYANWVMAVKGWERRDNPKQPATSNQSHSTIMV